MEFLSPILGAWCQPDHRIGALWEWPVIDGHQQQDLLGHQLAYKTSVVQFVIIFGTALDKRQQNLYR